MFDSNENGNEGFDAETSSEYYKLQAYVGAVADMMKATSADLARAQSSKTKHALYSDATLKVIGQLVERTKDVSNLLDKVQQSGQAYN